MDAAEGIADSSWLPDYSRNGVPGKGDLLGNLPGLTISVPEFTQNLTLQAIEGFRLPGQWVRTGNTLRRIPIALEHGSLALPTQRHSHW
jgi:hypothetical protein